MRPLALALVIAGLLASGRMQERAARAPALASSVLTSVMPATEDGQPVVPVSPPDPTVDYGACAICNVPSYLQPGPKTLVLKPAETAVFGHIHRELAPLETDCLYDLPYPSMGLEAGYLNFDTRGVAFGCTLNIIWQAGFNFDLSQLREARASGRWFPTDSVLTFKETPYAWDPDVPSDAGQSKNGAGDTVPTQTCWPRLAVPTADWSGGNRDLISNDVIREPNVIGRWSVYSETLGMVVDPATQRRGFLILGDNESMDANFAVCRSRIEDVQLTVSYTMGPYSSPAPTPTPLPIVRSSTTAVIDCPNCSVVAAALQTGTPQPAYHAPTIVGGWPQLSSYTQGEAVRSLQYLLQQSGATLTVDGKFGTSTDTAVRAFQKAQGLVVDGIVGPKTWLALIVTVQRGSQGAAVRAVQSQLKITVDGNFGDQTDAAVRTYQQAHPPLTVDGQVGPQTWQALLAGN